MLNHATRQRAYFVDAEFSFLQVDMRGRSKQTDGQIRYLSHTRAVCNSTKGRSTARIRRIAQSIDNPAEM
jgi:hypothetical protein